MKVICLRCSRKVYSCNAYLVLGDWNRLEDVNTLVDAGAVGSVTGVIEKISTGVGKKPVEQVILTHSHFDHTGGLRAVIEKYRPVVYAFARIAGVHRTVTDGHVLRLGDRYFEVMHTPGHSNDSICLYCAQEKVLFSGDTPLNIRSAGGSYQQVFVKSLRRIAGLDIKTIYSGHDCPVTENAGDMIQNTLKHVNSSRVLF
jgi:glyoxylase-like metal-dependent hydrolase (beta-lactamase superfamily II)